MLVVAIGAPPGVHDAVHRADPTLDSVVAAIGRLPADDVVLATRDPEARAVARAARLVLGSERLAILHLADVRVTAWAILLGGLSTPALPAASARAVAESLLANIRTRAILSTVASLSDPTPTFRQHAGSLLPNAAFVVDTVRGTVGRFQGVLALADGEQIVVARSARPVVPDADALLPREADVELDLPRTARAAQWPAPRWFEASALVAPFTSTLTDVTSRFFRWPACGVCGRSAPEACLFCDVATHPAPAGSRDASVAHSTIPDLEEPVR